MSHRSQEFWRGVKAELPLLVGVVPFGLIYGVLALGAGMPAGAALAMSSVVFAGSAQFVFTQLYAVGTPALVIILTIGVVNLRHALYSASVAPYLKPLRTSWKWLLAYLLTDEAYAVTIFHYKVTDQEGCGLLTPGAENLDQDCRHWFYLGAGLTLWSFWQISTALGIFLGAVVPANWSLDFSLALVFIAIIVPVTQGKASVAAALSAGIVAVLAAGMPLKLGLMLAALFGIAVGLLVEEKT